MRQSQSCSDHHLLDLKESSDCGFEKIEEDEVDRLMQQNISSQIIVPM